MLFKYGRNYELFANVKDLLYIFGIWFVEKWILFFFFLLICGVDIFVYIVIYLLVKLFKSFG